MKHKRRECVSLLLWTFIIMAVTIGPITAEEVLIPEEVFFFQPVASVFGQSSGWNNPAALGHQQKGSIFIISHREDRFVRDWGGAISMNMLAAAYREVNFGGTSDLKEYLAALGGGQKIKLGMSYRYFKEGPGYLNKRHLWNAALLIQHRENVSYGGRAENLNRGRIDGEKSDIRFVYGAAARFYRDLVTVSFEVDMTQKENLNAADFRTGIEVRPMPGMYLYADFDNHSRVNLGFRLNFGSSYAGHYHNFDRDFKSYRSVTYVGSVSGKQPSLTKLRSKTLVVGLDGELPENRKIPMFGKRPLKYFDYIEGIYRAADDDEISNLFLDIGELKCGMGKVEELTEAVRYFRARGKPTMAYLGTPNNLGYLLASSTDRIAIPPVSLFNLIGLRASLMTIKGLMDKVGIEAEIERVDEYKTAPERFIFDRPTEPNRQQVNRILDNLYAEMVETIAGHREMSADSVRELIDKGPLASVEAVECGLVDDTSYQDDALKEYLNGNDPDIPLLSPKISLYSYVNRAVYHDRWGEQPHLALIIADGSISSGKSGGRVGDFEMLSAIKKARRDRRVKGVVLRVNSPGGSALAADLIWHEIVKTAEKKPVVVSMGNVAASGGYYISCIDGDIFVGRCTVTGSIGVYGGKANIDELLDKIGIYTETYSRGRNAAVYSLYEPFTEDQRRQLKDLLRLFYRQFTEVVGSARGITPDSVNALGRGQVWTGNEAVANGLADHIGGLYQAILALSVECGIEYDKAIVVGYPEERYLIRNPFDFPFIYEKLAGWLAGGDEEWAASHFLESEHIFFRMPYKIEIE